MKQKFILIQEKVIQDIYGIVAKLKGILQEDEVRERIESITCQDLTDKELVSQLNQYKGVLLQKLKDYEHSLKEKKLQQQLNTKQFDLTIPISPIKLGGLHPVTQVKYQAINIMQNMGFVQVNHADIEDEFHNFDALNIPKYHPSRQEVDTFYIKPWAQQKSRLLLRTHTSATQIHYLAENYPPIKIFTLGRVFRHDADATHSPVFHQLELLYIDIHATLVELISKIRQFLTLIFEKEQLQLQIRSSYFPFTEPSLEVDIKINNQWLEIMGAGLVHPDVLKRMKIDNTKYCGYAWGIGLDRIAMIKYQITNLRDMFINDLRWLQHYS